MKSTQKEKNHITESTESTLQKGKAMKSTQKGKAMKSAENHITESTESTLQKGKAMKSTQKEKNHITESTESTLQKGKAMKSSTKSTKSSTKSAESTQKGKAVKSTKSTKSSAKSTKSAAPSIEELRALLAMMQASEASEASESEASEQASGKAPRTYEFGAIGFGFDKCHIGAVPASDRAKEYYTRQAALCERVLAACDAPIASEIRVGKMEIQDIISLCGTWVVSPMAVRVVVQLACPVVTVCCADTERLARVYGIDRANGLMGSRHNTSMYSKAKDKSRSLPFKRVAHNLTALGLDFSPCDNIDDCNFCDDEKSFAQLVTLCDYWLNTCARKKASKKASKQESKASKASGASKASERAQASDSDILSKLRALLGM